MNSRYLNLVLLVIISVSAPLWADSDSIQQRIGALEASSGGRIGVSAVDTFSNRRIAYRENELFPLCSTSKVMGVAAILKKSMTDKQLLQQKIRYTQHMVDASEYAPITQRYVKQGMTVEQLCAAALTYSDNNALNLLMKILGGPETVTDFARSIGDELFTLNRWEPALNSAIPGDKRDTSTPAAMEKSLQRLVLSDKALATSQRLQLQNWLIKNTTGDARIRAGVPKTWQVGDKTGTCGYGSTNDIGIIWPSAGCSPIVVAIYFTQKKLGASSREDIIASVTQLLVKEFSKKNPCIREH